MIEDKIDFLVVSLVSSTDHNVSSINGGIVQLECPLLVLVGCKFDESISKAVAISLSRDGQLVDFVILKVFSKLLLIEGEWDVGYINVGLGKLAADI